jgi:hypothetical protein
MRGSRKRLTTYFYIRLKPKNLKLFLAECQTHFLLCRKKMKVLNNHFIRKYSLYSANQKEVLNLPAGFRPIWVL